MKKKIHILVVEDEEAAAGFRRSIPVVGDPEAQPLLMRLEDDLLPALISGAAGRFEMSRLAFRQEAAACVVLAAAGYPGDPIKGDPIGGLAEADSREAVKVFHAGTRSQDGRVVSAGGRVLNVCATGPRLQDALKRAYAAAGEIRWANKVLRHDIGRRVVAHEHDATERIDGDARAVGLADHLVVGRFVAHGDPEQRIHAALAPGDHALVVDHGDRQARDLAVGPLLFDPHLEEVDRGGHRRLLHQGAGGRLFHRPPSAQSKTGPRPTLRRGAGNA